MNYCSSCGKPVVQKIPEGDNRPRYVCNHCSTIHYQNPRIIAGCLPTHGDSVLLCRRAIEPRHGLWTLPAGFMENGETVQQAAVRETWEEALAQVNIQGLYTLFNLAAINQVYVMFRGELTEKRFGPGIESLEVALFEEKDIPWDELAFPAIRKTLKHYFTDRTTSDFPVRMEDIFRRDPRR